MATLLSAAELTAEGEVEEEGGAGRWTAVSASVRVSEVTTAMAEATPPPAPPTPPGLLTVAAVVVVFPALAEATQLRTLRSSTQCSQLP